MLTCRLKISISITEIMLLFDLIIIIAAAAVIGLYNYISLRFQAMVFWMDLYFVKYVS